jgi:signal recognition particle subunit SEC65
MHFIYLILLFSLFQGLIASNNSPRMNYNHGIRNFGFKVVIFKEKKYPRLVEYIKQKYKIYYNKSMATIGESIIEYENLSHEEKELIDLILSSVFN